MESGPSWVNAPLEGPVIPRSRRDLFKDQSFVDCYNAVTNADRSHAGGALHAKEEGGRGGGAHRGWCSVEEQGDGERL
jgi:hypothetical protein